jgi:hypothetical protein
VQQLSDLRKEWASEIFIGFSTCDEDEAAIQDENITSREGLED